jgi:hypothetical protein
MLEIKPMGLKDSNKRQIGTFKVSFTVKMESEYSLNVNYQVVYVLFVPTGIEYFDVGITQTSTTEFNFEVAIDVDYSAEEHKYIQNNESGKIHRRGCHILTLLRIRISSTAFLRSMLKC